MTDDMSSLVTDTNMMKLWHVEVKCIIVDLDLFVQ